MASKRRASLARVVPLRRARPAPAPEPATPENLNPYDFAPMASQQLDDTKPMLLVCSALTASS